MNKPLPPSLSLLETFTEARRVIGKTDPALSRWLSWDTPDTLSVLDWCSEFKRHQRSPDAVKFLSCVLSLAGMSHPSLKVRP